MSGGLRVALVMDPKMVRAPFDPHHLHDSPRGLTGSEVAFFRYASELAFLNIGVNVYAPLAGEGYSLSGSDFGVWPIEAWAQHAKYGPHMYHAVVAATCADPLRLADREAFRVVHHQCNGFEASQPGWQAHVDAVMPLSRTHARHLATTGQYGGPMVVLPNGVDTREFKPAAKVPGKLIWASSHDRGLHRVLEAWPRIKRRAPHAELHVFYDTASVETCAVSYRADDASLTADQRDLGERCRYILAALPRLARHGVHLHGSVSRERIASEMATAEALAYPLDPVYFTETFGVTVLECMASGCVPVLCADDAFGELWGMAAECVPAPFKHHKAEWEDRLVRVLTDADYRAAAVKRCALRASDFEWGDLAPRLAGYLNTRNATLSGLEAYQ